jgi:hypothetical protein
MCDSMKRTIVGAVIALACIAGGVVVKAQTPTDKAKVVDVFGAVQKRVGDEKAKWENVSVGDLLPPKTTLKVGDKSAALLLLPDKHVFRVGAKTTVELRELGKDKSFSFNVLSGKVWSFVQSASKPTKYEVETPSAVVGVTGTLFSVFHDETENETMVSADDGEVTVRQGERKLKVAKGYLMRLRRAELAKAQATQQNEQMKRMWLALRQQENWMTAKSAMRLNRQMEERLRDIMQQNKQKRQPPPRRGSQRRF